MFHVEHWIFRFDKPLIKRHVHSGFPMSYVKSETTVDDKKAGRKLLRPAFIKLLDEC
jgi:hypothetical protein